MRDWETELKAMQFAISSDPRPSVDVIASARNNPWDVLVSTLISLRTKDAVTLSASQKLLAVAPGPQELLSLEVDEIAQQIYPAGFFRTKAKNLVKIAGRLLAEHQGLVPSDLESLLKLPGVGPKTANLVLSLGFQIPAICVDIHVHRIANRRGWISTQTPEESEHALKTILPTSWWIPLNGILVAYGQQICTPRSPRCSTCPLSQNCPQIDVDRSR